MFIAYKRTNYRPSRCSLALGSRRFATGTWIQEAEVDRDIEEIFDSEQITIEEITETEIAVADDTEATADIAENTELTTALYGVQHIVIEQEDAHHVDETSDARSDVASEASFWYLSHE